MTTISTAMSHDEYWNKISYDPLAYFDEFPADIVDDLITVDIDCLKPYDTIIKEEHEEISSSPEVIFEFLKILSIRFDLIRLINVHYKHHPHIVHQQTLNN
jgi:hypothetical protein